MHATVPRRCSTTTAGGRHRDAVLLGRTHRHVRAVNRGNAGPESGTAVHMPHIGADASRTKIGNYPHLNAYANFQLQHTRFYVMFTHVNSADGGKYFYTPHYPLNQQS